jgi:hypothetical protein
MIQRRIIAAHHFRALGCDESMGFVKAAHFAGGSFTSSELSHCHSWRMRFNTEERLLSQTRRRSR